MFFVFLGNDERPEAEHRFDLYNLHVFGQFALPLHLAQVLVILVLVLGIRDLDHVLVEQAHETRLLHRPLDLLQILTGQVVHLQVALLWSIGHRLF